MKPYLETIEPGGVTSIKVATYIQNLIDVPLHYHPYHEIVYIQKGRGYLLIGNSEEEFAENQLFFIRGNVPHLFHESVGVPGERASSRVSVIQYPQNLLDHFQHLPEFHAIIAMERSLHYGVRMDATAAMVHLVRKLQKSDGIFRFNFLTMLLHEMSSHNMSVLGNISRLPQTNQISYIRLKKMNSFLAEYAYRDLSLQQVAELLQLSKTSLSRFLKRETGKTFSEHLNFHRINYASKLLRESDEGVLQICYASGYNNPAYFFRQFKKFKKSTPDQYRKSGKAKLQ